MTGRIGILTVPVSRRVQFRLLVALTLVWAGWAGWSLLSRTTPYELRVLDDLGTPVASAVVDISGRQAGTSGDDGRIPLEWSGPDTVLEVSAPGHVPRTLTIAERPDGPVDVVLMARVLRGRVLDHHGRPVEGAVVTAGRAAARSDRTGQFEIRGAETGMVSVERPGWQAIDVEWAGGSGEKEIEIEPFNARAVHITGDAVRDRLEHFIEMAMSTELNALMIDLKDETGQIFYDTEDPVALEVGANAGAYNLRQVVNRAHQAGLYVIGRLVVFNDPIAARGRPSLAVWDSEANAPFNSRGQYFLDPTNPEAADYGIRLAAEACSKGVDEVQFDYIRFPDDRSEAAVFQGGVSEEARLASINGFLAEAVEILHAMGCTVAADVFGYLTTDPGDGGIGQRWEDVAMIVDVISPMIYPSHYDVGWYGFANPNEHPGPMIRNALTDAMERLPRTVVVRPWLQDFGYTASQVRAQIDVAEEFGLGWMLWNAASNVTTGALGESD